MSSVLMFGALLGLGLLATSAVILAESLIGDIS